MIFQYINCSNQEMFWVKMNSDITDIYIYIYIYICRVAAVNKEGTHGEICNWWQALGKAMVDILVWNTNLFNILKRKINLACFLLVCREGQFSLCNISEMLSR